MPLKTYDLYSLASDLENARAAVENALNTRFEAHESLYMGGDYYRLDLKGAESFELRKNLDPLDGEPAELDFPEVITLLYVHGTERAEELERILTTRIPGVRLLRRKTL